MQLKEIFKKQGGIKLLIQYLKSGILLTAINQFIVLGKSRTALEILRLSTQLKIRNKLYKKYIKFLRKFDIEYDNNLKHKTSNKVWVCWFQGIESAPAIVKKCYESLLNNLDDREIILITADNMHEYVDFPDYIYKKWKSGIINNTHMSDLLRLELLTRYGGMWLDATVLCTKKIRDIPDYYFNSELFFYQCLKPGKDGHSIYMSSWLMSSKSNNKILNATKSLCYEYWKKSNSLIDYYLVHYFLSISLDFYKDDWKKIVPVDNSLPHVLLLRLFEKYDDNMWQYIINNSPFHKLTYKIDKSDAKLSNTFYDKIMND